MSNQSTQLDGDQYAKKWYKAQSGSIYTFMNELKDPGLTVEIIKAENNAPVRLDNLVFTKTEKGTIFKNTESEYEERQKKYGSGGFRKSIRYRIADMKIFQSTDEANGFLKENKEWTYHETAPIIITHELVQLDPTKDPENAEVKNYVVIRKEKMEDQK